MLEPQLQEAEYLIKAYLYSTNEKRQDIIIELIRELLAPFVKSKHPRALWLKASMPNLGELQIIDKDFDDLWLDLVKVAAEGGCAEAQYTYGCTLYDNGNYIKAVELYRLSAESGYAPAQWCYGLDTLHGIGGVKNESLALFYIVCAAEQQYEYAVEFLLKCYTEELYGFKNDLNQIKKWKDILGRISFHF